MKLTVVILAGKPELGKLLLGSIAFADEILVIVDAEKTILPSDKKIKYIARPLDNDFSAQRNFALSKALGDWVLFVDDDEYVGTQLQREILEAIRVDNYEGFFLPRTDVVFHQPLLRGETGHIKILRLGKRTAGKFKRPVHEYWKIDGQVGVLSSPLYHIKDRFVSGFIGRMAKYAAIDSRILTGEGKPFSYFRLLFNPIAKFKWNYCFKGGFRDGTAGLFLAYLMAVQSLTVRIFQWENLK